MWRWDAGTGWEKWGAEVGCTGEGSHPPEAERDPHEGPAVGANPLTPPPPGPSCTPAQLPASGGTFILPPPVPKDHLKKSWVFPSHPHTLPAVGLGCPRAAPTPKLREEEQPHKWDPPHTHTTGGAVQPPSLHNAGTR